jgi:hypothetical protein
MRKILEAMSFAAVVVLWDFTLRSVAGAHKLSGTIPIHFDIAGRPDRWGTPNMLWLMVAIATSMYVLMTIVARFPSTFNFPAHVTPSNRSRLEALAVDMLAWIKAETMWLLALVQVFAVETARSGRNGLPAVLFPLGIAVVFGTIAIYAIVMRRAATSRELQRR